VHAFTFIRMALACDGSQLGVLTAAPGTLTNDFFLNLLTMNTVWSKKEGEEDVYEGKVISADSTQPPVGCGAPQGQHRHTTEPCGVDA